MTTTLLLAPKSRRTLEENVCAILANHWPKGSINVVPDTPEKKFHENCPAGSHPQIVTSEGVNHGASAVRMYLSRAMPQLKLAGQGPFEEAKVENFWEGIITATQVGGDQKGMLPFFNSKLQMTTFIVGERVTVADVITVAFIHTYLEGEKGISEFPHLLRWYHTLMGRKAFSSVLDTPAAKAAPAPKAPVAEEEDEAPPKKTRNPLDDLPASSLNLDEWKRTYSNTKNAAEALAWFWEHHDSEGYSFWYMKYDKTPDELKVAFLASNHLSGFIQRIDNNFRKYSFAVLNIVGKDGDFDVQGVWMFRGQEIPFEMKDHPSFEYQSFRKLDHTKAEDKELIRAYWTEDNVVEGRPIADCKVWK